ncbi:hypothetical protein B0H10DRAFT_868555 [Mycena sp. CBHHK59/15]|nr:hypothetical protein B0H10DRAFT_868555 [Mycena sp. CBHHK59/15]
MLNYCFGEGFDFLVAPRAPPAEAMLDFIVYLLILGKHMRPVLIVVVIHDTNRDNPARRDAADTQMRAHYNDFLYACQCPIPTLYGLSILGPRMRLYTGDTATMQVSPPRTAQPRQSRFRSQPPCAWVGS